MYRSWLCHVSDIDEVAHFACSKFLELLSYFICKFRGKRGIIVVGSLL